MPLEGLITRILSGSVACLLCLPILHALLSIEGSGIDLVVWSTLGGLLVWFYLLKWRLSRSLCSFLCVLTLSEWMYLYGKPGPFFGLAFTLLFVHSKIWRNIPLPKQVRLWHTLLIWLLLLVVWHVTYLGKYLSDQNSFQLLSGLDAVRLLISFSLAFVIWRGANSSKPELLPLGLSTLSAGALCVIFFLLSQVMTHEYAYYYGRIPKYLPHPSLVGAQYILVILSFVLVLYSIFSRDRDRTLLRSSLLSGVLLVVFLLLRELSVSRCWIEANLSYVPKNFDWWNWLVGLGPGWREIVSEGTRCEPTAIKEFPLSMPVRLLLIGGLPLTVLGLSVLYYPLKSLAKNNRFPLWVRAVVIPSLTILIFIPGFHLPFVLVMFLHTVSVLHLQSVQPVTEVAQPFERWLKRSVIIAGLCIFAFLLTQVIAARSKLAAGPRNKAHEPQLQVRISMVRSLITAEDLLFFVHSGIDFARVKWTIQDTLRSGKITRGASTLSMQLAKMQYLDYEKSFTRKIQQAIIALNIERQFTKEEILRHYLLIMDFRAPSLGVEAASQHYFGKSVREITEFEALQLILTIPDPGIFNPQLTIDSALRQKIRSMKRKQREFKPLIEPHLKSMKLFR